MAQLLKARLTTKNYGVLLTVDSHQPLDPPVNTLSLLISQCSQNLELGEDRVASLRSTQIQLALIWTIVDLVLSFSQVLGLTGNTSVGGKEDFNIVFGTMFQATSFEDFLFFPFFFFFSFWYLKTGFL